MTDQAMAKRNGEGEATLPALKGPRLPYHPMIEERFGIDRAAWKALVEAIFPGARSTESVILALSYCRARRLDPFKRAVHIVPIWDRQRKCEVETVWPGIGEMRTTAFRTRQYAGRDATVFGPDKTMKFPNGDELTFPEWAQVTVYRMIGGQRVPFQGPPVYWLETYAETKDGSPNAMWKKRPRGQLDKCAEAAALRAAFPEELGDEYSDAEAGLIVQHGSTPPRGVQIEGQTAQPARLASRLEAFEHAASVRHDPEPDTPDEEEAPATAAAPDDEGARSPAPAPDLAGGAEADAAAPAEAEGFALIDVTGEVLDTIEHPEVYARQLANFIEGSSMCEDAMALAKINAEAVRRLSPELRDLVREAVQRRRAQGDAT